VAHLTTFCSGLTLPTVAAACAPLQLLGIKSSSLINKQQCLQKDQSADKEKLRGKKKTPELSYVSMMQK